MNRSWWRLALLALFIVVTLSLVALGYRIMMAHFEGQERSYLQAFSWASETLTSTGYGAVDGQWSHPMMVSFVVFAQFIGQGTLLVAFPFVVIPFFEERFELRLPRVLPRLRDYVLVYHENYVLDGLIEILEERGVPVVVCEEEESLAKNLRERGRRVVFGNPRSDATSLQRLKNARAIVVNGSDHANTSMVMWARERGYEGPIYAMAASTSHARPLVLAGATQALSPNQVLAAALASKASIKLSPPIMGLGVLEGALAPAQIRIGAKSCLAGTKIQDAQLREQTGAIVIGVSDPGMIDFSRARERDYFAGSVIMALGTPASLEDLGRVASTEPVYLEGPILVIGYGTVGSHVAHSLRGVHEHVVVIDSEAKPGVDMVGDALEPTVLKNAGLERARAVVVALSADSSSILASALIREIAPSVPIIARVNSRDETHRLYRIGVDFALSFGDVASDMLVPLILQSASPDSQALLKVRALEPGRAVGMTLAQAGLFEKLRCTVLAIRRDGELMIRLAPSVELQDSDVLYVCGEERELVAFCDRFDSTPVHMDQASLSSTSMTILEDVG